MAQAPGVSPSAGQRIWTAHGLKPHLTRTFKLSRAPHFNENVADVIGIYFNPPGKALVLSVSEKSQVHALDRTQPSLPMKKGALEPRRMIPSAMASRRCSPRSTFRAVRPSAPAKARASHLAA